MTGKAESTVLPAIIETCRIVNVNIETWSVNVMTEHGGKYEEDIQIMSPYFHYHNGEGMYVVPEVGALAWVCFPSTGDGAAAFILGFQAPHDEDHDSYACGRQSFNPGDIVLRTRDENFIVVRRGGVVQIGATPTAQRMYIPIQNVIRDFCENYELNTFGGELIWETKRDEETTSGDALTKFSLLAKQKADDPLHIAELTIGSHGEDEPTTMKLLIWSDGTKERAIKVQLAIKNDGDVVWDVEKDYVMNVGGEILITAEGDISHLTKANYVVSADENIEVSSSKKHEVVCENSVIQAGKSHVVDSAAIKLGSAQAIQPAVKGTDLVTVLNQICTVISTLTYQPTGAPSPVPVIGAIAIAAPQATLTNILAQKVKLE